MKRIILFIAFISLGIGANAQSMKLQSAIADLKNKRLDKAKLNIDAASEHESTKDDPKTWYYKSMIYTELANTDKPKFKDLAENPLQTAYEAALKCMELDTKKEFVQGNATNNSMNFERVSVLLYNKAIDLYNQKEYAKAMEYFELVPQVNKYSGKRNTTDDAFNLAANSAQLIRDNDALRRIYTAAVAANVKTIAPFVGLYHMYKADNDTTAATRLALRISRNSNFSKEYVAFITLADSYLWTGEKDKALEALNKAVEINPEDDMILNAVGLTYEQAGDFLNAEQKYLASLKIKPEQYAANYYMGALYFNKAADLYAEANDVPTSDQTGKYDKLKDEADNMFANAIPYLRRALELKENDYNSLLALKQIYARLVGSEADKDGSFGNELKAVTEKLQSLE